MKNKIKKKERESKEFQCVMEYFEERREHCPNFTEEEFEAFKDDEKFSMFGGDFKMKSISLVGQTQTQKALDFVIFVEYAVEISVDVLTGVRV